MTRGYPAFIDAGTPNPPAWSADQVRTLADLGLVLRELRRRQARRGGGGRLSYRDLAAATGWSHGIIGEYLAGRVLPPTDRFDTLIRLLGATTAEQGALATARDRVEESRRAGPAPRQLPADVFGFTGRDAELAALDAVLAADAVVGAVAGTAGVGKTALAVHWAHRVAKRFPHGQLYIDLRGYDPEEPVPPADALAALLRGLGVPAGEVPGDLAERAARYRSALAGKRVLVLLDNAAGAEQVRPLLPGQAGCFALVTSRDSLAGLVVREGARRVDLDLLPPAQARRLLETLIGARAVADPRTTDALADSCARLPLALRIAAEIATTRPALALPDLLADLRDERRRLDLLEVAGDPRSALRAVFSWSLRQLRPARGTGRAGQDLGAAAAFPLLGLHPGGEFSGYALAALAGCPLATARALLAELHGAHLVVACAEPAGESVAGDPRYTMHDLLRAYAVELAAGLPEAQRRAAQDRLADHYLATAAAAMDTLYPHERAGRPPVRPSPTPAPPVRTSPDALRFLDRERANLVALAGYATRHGRPADAVGLSAVLWRYFEVGGHHQEALAVHTLAVAASGGEGAAAQASLGGIHWWLGDHGRALAHLEAALAGFRRAGDQAGEARALARLALVHERLGDYPRALAELTGAMAIHRRTGNRHGAAGQLLNLGILYRRLGRYAWSAGAQRTAARVFAELGDRRLEGYALGNLAAVENLLGRHTDALEHLRQSLSACRDAGDRGGEGSALATIGAVYQRMRRYPQALDHLNQGLRISRETGDRALETETLSALGRTLLAMGLPGAALAPYRGALALAEAAGDRYEQARALTGIGEGLEARGEATAAGAHWQRALSIYQELGVPEAEALRRRLAPPPAGPAPTAPAGTGAAATGRTLSRGRR